ncbi:MAG: RHS repeat-associated core domain-containing protein [Lentisphaerae bacterium]|nr:RHS repeat-associated core domain-containing protein [Lentisphaerota bacterium]
MNAIVNANQHTTALHYDALGRLARVAPQGHPDAAFEYAALGHLEKVSEPGPDGSVRETLLENNAFGRPTRVVHPDGAEESFKYDAHWRRVVESVDALGRTNAYDWVLGVPVLAKRFTASRPAGIPLFALSHDQQMNTLSISDPLGRRAESYVLDANERVVAVTNLEGQAMTREFLVGGVVGRIGRYDGSQVSFDYSGDGDLRTVAYPDGSLAFTYDRDGLLLTASGAAGTVANEYNEAAWLTKTRGVDGAEVAYGYHPAGQVSNVVTVAGATGYALDTADRLSRIAAPSAAFDYAYNSWNGYVSAVTNTGGLVSEYQYDIMDRPTNIVWRKSNGSTLARFGYAYNAVGMITDHARTVGATSTATAYGYDDLDRLASETESTGASRTYGYDLAGNRLSKTQTGSTPIAYTLGIGDRLATYTGGSYSYNAAGCVTAIDRTGRPDLALTWNGQYQLTSVSTNGVVAESYAYDPLGRRASTTTSGGVTVRHVYDGAHCAADIDAAGAVVRSYTWGPGIDNLLAVTCHSGSSATTYYALTDVQGTVHGFADASGELFETYAYDAWGNVLTVRDANGLPIPNQQSQIDNRFLFQGREYSWATGLYNFRLRWYDPATGRWISKDPIGISGGLNLYAFCGNDPVNYMDPWGLCRDDEGFSLLNWLKNDAFNVETICQAWELLSGADYSTARGWGEGALGLIGGLANVVDAGFNLIPGKGQAEAGVKTAIKKGVKSLTEHQLAKLLNLGAKESIHSVKKEILKDAGGDVLKTVGKNPNIAVDAGGKIVFESQKKKGVSVTTDLLLENYRK